MHHCQKDFSIFWSSSGNNNGIIYLISLYFCTWNCFRTILLQCSLSCKNFCRISISIQARPQHWRYFYCFGCYSFARCELFILNGARFNCMYRSGFGGISDIQYFLWFIACFQTAQDSIAIERYWVKTGKTQGIVETSLELKKRFLKIV